MLRMEFFIVYATLLPLLAVAIVARSTDRRRIAAIERSLALIVNHLGIVEPEPAEVARHLDKRDRVKAVHAYMKITGTDLRTANDAVKRMAAARRAPEGDESMS